MTRMIILLSVVIVLFAAAAGGSWYLQNQHAKDTETTRGAEEKPGKSTNLTTPAKTASSDAPVNRPVIKPLPTSGDSDRLTHLAAALQQQQESIKARETQITAREKQMDIVHDQVKREQKKLEALRKEIQAELQLVQEKIELLEKRASEGVVDRKLTEAQKKDLERATLEFDTQEWKNLKDQVKTFEKMDAEAAAAVVVQMVDSGKMETAVKMLSQMRDRQAAAIFAEIARQDAKLPGQLFERMLTLKSPTVAAPK